MGVMLMTEPAAACRRLTRTLLVVEDEDFLRIVASESLRRQGYQVIEARDAAEARHALRPGSPVDLVFTDVHMPGEESGLDLARWIAQNLPHVAVLVASGEMCAVQGRGLPFLSKPYRHAQVRQAIQRLLSDPRPADRPYPE